MRIVRIIIGEARSKGKPFRRVFFTGTEFLPPKTIHKQTMQPILRPFQAQLAPFFGNALLACWLLMSMHSAQAADSLEHLNALQGTRVHVLDSVSLQHRYYVHVKTPAAAQTGQRYPVVYLLDGGLTFPLLAAYQHTLEFTQELPQVVLVGIAYGSDDWRQGNRRSTDFTAPAKDRDHYGGAEAFVHMLRTELMPLVEHNHSIDPSRRVLFGQSLGGQLAIILAMHHPDLFDGLIASNPALHNNLSQHLQPAAKLKDAHARPRLFIATAEHDDARFKAPFEQWLKHWQAQKQKPWEMHVVRLPGHGHLSAAPEAYRLGLRWLLDAQAP